MKTTKTTQTPTTGKSTSKGKNVRIGQSIRVRSLFGLVTLVVKDITETGFIVTETPDLLTGRRLFT